MLIMPGQQVYIGTVPGRLGWMVTLILYQNPHLKIKMKIRILKDSEKYSSKETCFILVNSTFPKFILLWHPDPAFLPSEKHMLAPNKCFQSRKVKEMWESGGFGLAHRQQWKERSESELSHILEDWEGQSWYLYLMMKVINAISQSSTQNRYPKLEKNFKDCFSEG